MFEMPQGDTLPVDESLQVATEEQQDVPTMLYMMVHDKYRGILDALTVNSIVEEMLTDINAGKTTVEELKVSWS